MGLVEFDENNAEYQPARNFIVEDVSAVTNFFIKIGIAKNTQQANMVMIIVTIFCILTTLFILFFSGPKSQIPVTTSDLNKSIIAPKQ